MSLRRLRASEDGWVMVPVMVLIVVAIGVGLAVVAVVDEQTQQSRSQRDVDAAQTLAEGVVSATTRALAADQSATVWRATGTCRQVTGDLSTTPAGSTTLDDRIAGEIQARFLATHDYATSAARKTTWRVDLCPVQGSEKRWEDAFLTRTVSAAAPKTSLWVRGQTRVRGAVAAAAPSTRRVNGRALVTQVRQQTVDFVPPQDFAVGTGAFSTDVGASLSGLLTSDQAIAGKLLNGVLGTQPLIKDGSADIGVRCGLLSRLGSGSACLAGTLAGLSATTKSVGLSVLNGPLGIDRFHALPSWTMAPPDAVDAWRAEAQRSNTYYESVAAGAACPSGSASQVVFIQAVGNGDQSCTVTGGEVKILIVGSGRVRVTGSFKGIVYALNLQECGPDGTCTSDERKYAASREVVRIEKPGNVKGQVWADGAGGLVGIYPASTAAPDKTALLNVGGSSGVCGLPAVSGLVSTLTSTLNGVLGLVGSTLSLLGGTQQEEVRSPNGAANGCDLLRNQLGSLPTNDVVGLFGAQSTQSITTSEHRTRNCVRRGLLGIGCAEWGPWSAWTARETTNAALPALVTGASSSVLDQLTGVLANPLSSYTAIEYDPASPAKATSHIPQGASPVSGTYRNVRSAAG